MTKAKKARTQRRNASAPKGPRPGKEFLDVLQSLGEEEITVLLNVVQNELGIPSGSFAPSDPVDLFKEYLAGDAGRSDEDKSEFLEELVSELSNVRVDANGGLREAREKVQVIYALLDRAIEDHALPAWDMVLTGKILVDAGWVVPDVLKEALASALKNPPPFAQDAGEGDVVSSLADLAQQAGQNPFDIHDHVNSYIAAFPPDAAVAFLSTLAAAGKPTIQQALAGFVLHQDAALAQAAAEALAETAQQAPVEALQIDRLVRMRPWLAPERQGVLDRTIRAMRLNALPPAQPQMRPVLKCYVSVCDGTGTRSLFAAQRAGDQYQIATVMMKTSGATEAMILPELLKSAMDRIIREMKANLPVTETDAAGLTRTLQLALADNLASQSLPPFKLVEVTETLGLGQLHSDHATPTDICARLLADLPPEQTEPGAVARAHAKVLDSGLEYQWFEAGEAVDDLLRPLKGFVKRVNTMMTVYLPERRQFWARQCALSALALCGDNNKRNAAWKPLALVGREIASDVPLDRIPLMKQIAETSVEVLEYNA